MLTYNKIKWVNFSSKIKKNIQLALAPKTLKFKYYYFFGLAAAVISLILCLWAAIQLGVIQAGFLNHLNSLSDEQLILQYPVFDPANDSVWLLKGFGPYAWYLTARDSLGMAAYWCVGIFGVLCLPLLTYYISSFLIVVFPKQSKTDKQAQKQVLQTQVEHFLKEANNGNA